MPRLLHIPPPDAFPVGLDAYGGLYVEDGDATQTINIAPAKMTGFTATSSVSKNLTLSPANDSITIVVSGVYAGAVSIAYTGGANIVTEIHLRVDAVEAPEGLHRKISGGDVGSASFQILPQTFTAGQVLTLYVEADADTQDFTPIDAQFSIWRVA
jgi:hypothetical protein